MAGSVNDEKSSSNCLDRMAVTFVRNILGHSVL